MKTKVLTIIVNLIFATTLAYGATQEELKEQCESKGGYEWNSELNTCKYTQASVETKESHDECADSSDPDKCYMETAQTSSGVSQGEGKNNKTTGAMLAKTAAGAYSLFSAVGP